jgi:biopolymer transport protein ExbD
LSLAADDAFVRARITACGILIASAACDHGSRRATGAPSASESTPAAGPIPADVALATSRSTTAIPSDPIVVILSRARLALGRDGVPFAIPGTDSASWSEGFDAKYKRGGRADFFIVPLAAALEAHLSGDAGLPEVAIAADASISYRMLCEVIFTVGQERASKVSILVRSDTGVSAIEIALPGPNDPDSQAEMRWKILEALQAERDGGSRPPSAHLLPPKVSASALAAESVPLWLNVSVGPDGFIVSAAGRRMGPGCHEEGTGTAVPRLGGAYDFAALTACASTRKGSAPAFATETKVTVSASASTDLQTVVSTMDALRGTDTPLFPKVALGVPR